MGQQVLVRNVGSGSLWMPGTIEKVLGPISYLVWVRNNLLWKQHLDHIKMWTESPYIQPSGAQTSEQEDWSFPGMFDSSDCGYVDPSSLSVSATPASRPRHRYPTREHRSPDRLVFHIGRLMLHIYSAGATTSQVVRMKNTSSARDVTGSCAIRWWRFEWEA